MPRGGGTPQKYSKADVDESVPSGPEPTTKTTRSCLGISLKLLLGLGAAALFAGAYASACAASEASEAGEVVIPTMAWVLGGLGLVVLAIFVVLWGKLATCARAKPQGPLAGIKVLDISVVVAAPFAASQLSELGAEVIKVESTPTMGQPDSARALGTSPARGLGGMFMAVARGKQSVILNMKSEEGKATFLDLARQCDVVIQNFRPGATDKMGIGYDACKAVNPNIIYLSSSGFGGAGGPYDGGRVYDPIIQCAAGIADVQRTDDGQAKVVAQIVFDKLTAMTATQAVVAALVARDRGVGGQHIKMSMLDAAVNWLFPDCYYNRIWKGNAGPKVDKIHRLEIATKENALDKISPTEAAQSQVSNFEAVPTPLFKEIMMPKPPAEFSGTPLGSRPAASMMGQETVKILSELGYSSDKVEGMLAGGPKAVAVSTKTLMQMMAGAMKAGKMPGGEKGAAAAEKGATGFGLIEKFQSGGTFDHAHPPLNSAAFKPLAEGAGPMDGVVVLDFCSMLAGSMAATMLADEGANCVKIEAPGHLDEARKYGQQPKAGVENMGAMFMAANRNKKGVLLDYTGEDLEKVEALIGKADVIFVDAESSGLAISYKTVKKLNKGAIYVSIEKDGGEWAVQANSGMLYDQTDEKGNPTQVRTMEVEKNTAAYAATAATAAYYARMRGSSGQKVSVSMMRTALHGGAVDTLMNDLWKHPGGTGAAQFPTIGQCYQLCKCKCGQYIFMLALSDAECHSLMLAFPDDAKAEVRHLPLRSLSSLSWRRSFCAAHRCRTLVSLTRPRRPSRTPGGSARCRDASQGLMTCGRPSSP